MAHEDEGGLGAVDHHNRRRKEDRGSQADASTERGESVRSEVRQSLTRKSNEMLPTHVFGQTPQHVPSFATHQSCARKVSEGCRGGEEGKRTCAAFVVASVEQV